MRTRVLRGDSAKGLLVALVTLAGCKLDTLGMGNGGGTGIDSTGDATVGQTATTAPTATTSGTGTDSAGTAPTTTTPDPTTSSTGTVSVGTSTGEVTTGTSMTTGVACGDPPLQPNHSTCNDQSGCGCVTGKCFVVPALGGWCGQCLTDADCAPVGGCTVPNPVIGVGSTCNTGGPGDGCMSDAVCEHPDNAICGTVLEVPGIITVATCGACEVNADCTEPGLPNCTPYYEIASFSGWLGCVADGEVNNNLGCSLEDDGGVPAGDKACKSGFCGEASIMGLVKVGICGECRSDNECPMGLICTDAVVDLDNGVLVGSVCV